MMSGAEHDAIDLAKHYPATMIFTSCQGGVAHNKAEAITEEQVVKGMIYY